MRNFKKLFGIVATVLMVLNLLPVAVLGASSYSAELEAAYDYAYGVGITTQSSIDTANLYGQLTRGAMAKMMVNYAQEVLGKTANTSVECNFNDVANQSPEFQGYIVDACQLGLMGLNSDGTPATTFNPNGVVNRAQFGTVLSRALYGDVNNGGDPFYANHLTALQDDGVMNNISNPNAPEVRGYVMLMMQRADEAGVATDTMPSVCSTPENTLSCALGLNTCPAECTVTTTPEVKAGNLSVSFGSQLANMTSVPKVGTITVATLKFAASSSDVTIHGLKLAKVGLGDRAGIYRVFMERNGLRVTGKASFTTDGQAELSFSSNLVVKAGSTENIDFVVMLSGTDVGNEYAFNFTSVDTTAESVDMSTLTTNTIRTASYTVATSTILTLGTTTSIKANEATNVELAKFSIANANNEERTTKFKAITLRNEGTADIAASAKDWKLYKDSTVVSSDYVINGKDITFAVNSEILANQTNTYYVKGTVTHVEAAAGDTYKFYVRNTEDLNVTENVSMFRTTVTNSFSTSTTYTVNGGDLSFTKDTALATSQTIAPATTTSLLLKGTITSKEAITLEDVKLRLNINNPTQTVNKFTLKIGNSSSTFTPTGTGAFTGDFDGSWTVNGTVPVTLTVDVKSTATGGTITLVNALGLDSFTTKTYVASQNTVTTSIGSIAGSILTVKAPSLYLTRTDGLSDRNVVKGSQGVTLFEGKLGTNESQTINITAFQFSGVVSDTTFDSNLSTTLYVNGVAVSSKAFASSKADFNGLNINVSNGNDATIKLVGDFNSSIATGKTLTLTLKSISATDSNSQTVAASPTFIAAAMVTTSDAGSVTIVKSSTAQAASLIAAGTMDQEVAKLSVSATNDDVKLTDLYLINSGSLDLGLRTASPKLYNAAGALIANGTIISNVIVFKNIDSSANKVVVTPATSQTLIVKLNVNGVLNTGDLQSGSVQLKLGTGDYDNVTAGTVSATRFISNSNGNDVTVVNGGYLVLSDLHKVVRGMPVLTSNSTTPDTNRLMNFKVTSNGNKISLTGLSFTMNNGTGNMVLSIYKNSVSSANLLGT